MALTTHVLDTANGCPAAGMRVDLLDDKGECIGSATLNSDGRVQEGPLLSAEAMRVGSFCLKFHVAEYFRARGTELTEPPFIDVVALDFGIADTSSHYHVPLLVSPYGYSTYRGS